MSLLDKINNWQYGLLFDIRRSIRYHDRRRSFFEFLHRITNFLTILMAGSVLFELAETGGTAWWLKTLGVLAVLFATMDMVVSYSRQAGIHNSLKDRFSILEIAMISGATDENTWLGFQRERLNIEKDEPPIYNALDALCRNELLLAEGHSIEVFLEKRAHVNWYEKLTSNTFRWTNLDVARNSRQ